MRRTECFIEFPVFANVPHDLDYFEHYKPLPFDWTLTRTLTTSITYQSLKHSKNKLQELKEKPWKVVVNKASSKGKGKKKSKGKGKGEGKGKDKDKKRKGKAKKTKTKGEEGEGEG